LRGTFVKINLKAVSVFNLKGGFTAYEPAYGQRQSSHTLAVSG